VGAGAGFSGPMLLPGLASNFMLVLSLKKSRLPPTNLYHHTSELGKSSTGGKKK
jgi:hypothetical protein